MGKIYYNKSYYIYGYNNLQVGDIITDGGNGVGWNNLCVYAIILVIVLFVIFLIYLFYFKAYGLKSGKKHRCNYCGQLVEVVSDCCNAGITERFLIGVCQKCGKECKMICSRCRKSITG